MSFVQTQTLSFKKELYRGVHDLVSDTIKLALYTSNATLNDATTEYTATGETSGTGYSAGGVVLTGTTVNGDATTNTAYVTFDDAEWPSSSFVARGGLIYNSTQGNKAIAVLDFGSDKTAGPNFTVQFPANTASTAIIRST